ncbi:MAG: hypothetical protein HZA77_04970 [Candidatus Schekmanbacteria bacterium]|nr:hypothetical protein [Candidatus Schekmanbacteria bacterium]
MTIKREDLVENNTINIFCGKCNGKSPHNIRSVSEDKVKIHCNGCGKNSTRLVRRLLNEKEPGIRKSKKRTSSDRLSGIYREESYYNKLLSSNPKPYIFRESYILDDIISHDTFGLGKVVEQKGDNKIIVLFYKHGEKMLICGTDYK